MPTSEADLIAGYRATATLCRSCRRRQVITSTDTQVRWHVCAACLDSILLAVAHGPADLMHDGAGGVGAIGRGGSIRVTSR